VAIFGDSAGIFLSQKNLVQDFRFSFTTGFELRTSKNTMAASPSASISEMYPVSMLAHALTTETCRDSVTDSPIAEVVREGLLCSPKRLPPWLFYDASGSLLFDRITELPEYYLTRLERGLLAAHAGEMIATAADGERLRMVELGAGSADKTRTLLAAALAHQGTVEYLPVDVSETALKSACERIEDELPGVLAAPVVADYTREWAIPDQDAGERQLLIWIGSSIGNFEPEAAVELLRRINATMQPGDGLLLGADLAPVEVAPEEDTVIPAGCKCVEELVAAYDDAAGVTAAFNRNLLVRLNRELGAEFEPEGFAHCAVWNRAESRMEMHLESREAQSVWIEALEMEVCFAAGERLHTENSYKYTAEQVAGMMALAGFPVERHWLAGGEAGPMKDRDGAWFGVMLGRKG
jgi:dimethylhistidine N-methyltransferase